MMKVLHTFAFAENEGPLSLPFEFEDMLDPSVRLDDYDVHAHFKLDPDDGPAVFEASSGDGSFAITDAFRQEAEITIPLATVAANFPGCGIWFFDVLLIERVTGQRINAGRFAMTIGDAYTRGVA